MKYPNFLSKTIYLASPSMGCATSYYKPRLDKAIENFKSLGYEVINGPYIFNDGLLSSTPSNLGKELNDAYGKYDLIMSVGGGEIMVSILDFIDFNKICSSTPSWFMGYSDNTNFSFLLNTICDTASIYAGCAPEFGTNGFIEYQNDQLALMTGKKLSFEGYEKYEIESLKSVESPYENLNMTEISRPEARPSNILDIKGRIIGGCLDVLDGLIGTKFDNMKEFNNKYDDIIFALEACDFTPIQVYRSLVHMKNAGWFNKTKAFFFGRPCHTEEMFGMTYKDYIIDALKDLGVPIVFDLDIGHVKPQIPVIMGSIAHLEFKSGKYKITYELK